MNVKRSTSGTKTRKPKSAGQHRQKKRDQKAKCKRRRTTKYEKVGKDRFRCQSCERVKPLTTRVGCYCSNCKIKKYISTIPGALRFRYINKKSVAKRNGIPFTISFEAYKEQFEKQQGKDGYTGKQMFLDFGHGRSALTITLDRIDNNKGYVEGNIKFCCLNINAKKGKRPVEMLYAQLELNFPDEGCPDNQANPKEELNSESPIRSS